MKVTMVDTKEVELGGLLEIVSDIKKSDKDNVLLEVIAKREDGKNEDPMYFYVFSETKHRSKDEKTYYIHPYSTMMSKREIADWLLKYKKFEVKLSNENIESDYYKVDIFYPLDDTLRLVLDKYKQRLEINKKRKK